MVGVEPPPVLQRDKKSSAYRVKTCDLPTSNSLLIASNPRAHFEVG